MNAARLTTSARAAITRFMHGENSGVRRAKRILPLMLSGPVVLAGCIQVDAPSEPIVIELNINIQSEVLVRLAEDAEGTIEENADIF